MEIFEQILEKSFLNNDLRDLLIALGLFIVLLILFKLFKLILLKRLMKLAKKTKTKIDEICVETLENIHRWIYVVLALYFPIKLLELPAEVIKWVDALFIIIIILQLIRTAQFFIDNGMKWFAQKKGSSADEAFRAFAGIRFILRLIVWTIGLLLILSNIGVNVTSLVAGLGIGGIAVALALQNILGDIFSSFSIYFDKPFQIGDFIVAGEHFGIVKKIGIKSTRIQALQGEEIVISNKELTSTRIQNFKKMQRRRVILNFGLVYDTKVEKLKKATEIVKDVITKIPDLDFDRCHFFEFGDFSLKFETVYFVNSGDYNVFMDKQQEVNLAIKERFEEAEIEMAFPTQTLHVNKMQ